MMRHAVPLAILALFALVPLIAEVWGGSYLTSLAIRAMVLAIAALSLDLLIGNGGMVSFGHAAFVGIGAYVTGILVTEGVTDFATIVALTIVAAALFGTITGAISLRTSGVYFIMITLAFGQMLFFTTTSLSTYGGDDGLTLWERPTLFGSDLLYEPLVVYALVLGTLALTWVLLGTVTGARFGRVLRAARDNPVRVSAMGFDVMRYRLVAYVIAGVIAALAGVLMATQDEFVSPATLAWQRSGDLIVMVVLGGMGTRSGPVLGAIAVVALEEGLSTITHDWRLIYGPLLILAVLYARGGLSALVERRS